MKHLLIFTLIVFPPLASLRGTKQSHEMRVYRTGISFMKSRIKSFLIFFYLIALLPFTSTSQSKNENAEPIHISIKDHDIYNNDLVIGAFKNIIIDSELTSIVIYNQTKSRVAEATHATGDQNWTIATPVDQNKMYLPWSKERPLELLFKFLVEKKYL